MTRVDFYVLQDTSSQAVPQLACRIAEKAWKKGHRVYLHTGSDAQLRQMDDLLWTFRAGSFLPHAPYAEHDNSEPVLLGHDIDPASEHDVLINLTSEVPAFFTRFNRVVEPVAGDDASQSAARERYRFYMDRGYTLETHKL